jgi:hypothetical protein
MNNMTDNYGRLDNSAVIGNIKVSLEKMRAKLGSHQGEIRISRCLAAASAPMDWLNNDHVGTQTHTHVIIGELYFLLAHVEGL